VRETAERLTQGTPLTTALAGMLEGRAAPAAARVRLFVGAPGDGKTTTIVKLAAQARRAGRRVTLVGTDTYRVGAAAELETYGRALGVPVTLAPDGAALGRALASTAGTDLVLVDTAGVAPGQARELAELGEVAAAAGGEARRTLVASAATGAFAARQLLEAFAPLAPDACVLTKCDVAPGGPLLGLCWRRGMPVTHVAAGRRIPDDLEPATPDRLVRCLIAA
jgi:flagellar biosynthesis protein FlhF